MNLKRTLGAVLAAGMLLVSVAGEASAAPNDNASCLARHHAVEDGGLSVAALAQEEGGVAHHAKPHECDHH